MAFVAAGQTLEARDDDPAYPALFLWNYMLGGSPSSRLFLRLRQKEGISYGAFSQLVAHPIDKQRLLLRRRPGRARQHGAGHGRRRSARSSAW